MFYKYLTKQNRPKHKSATQHQASWPSTRPKLFQKQSFSFIETCFYVHVFFGPMLGYSSNILGVSIKLLLQIDCSLSNSEN